MNFVSKTMNFVSKTMNFVSKTMNFVLQMMNFAGKRHRLAIWQAVMYLAKFTERPMSVHQHSPSQRDLQG